MTTLEIVLALLTLVFVYFSIKFALIILRVQDAIEESFDALDEKHKRLSEITKTPVFFNSPEIKNIISEIVQTKEIILYIANRLSNSIDEKNSKEILKETSSNIDDED